MSTPDFRHLVVSDITAYLAEKFGISDSAAQAHAEKLVDYVEEISSVIRPRCFSGISGRQAGTVSGTEETIKETLYRAFPAVSLSDKFIRSWCRETAQQILADLDSYIPATGRQEQ